MNHELNRLPQDVVNQIAAGEVIERPASVVKELVDNAIDAEAKKITIKVRQGGMESIEVSDDGYGIPKRNLSSIFDAHTTSKLKTLEDLNSLLSMGFRGEALSTITSVAQVSLVSKYTEEDFANEIFFSSDGKSSVKSAAKEKGTTIKVENLFYNIPARKKYLKSPVTEYRKIQEMLDRYFIIYPNISFVLERDGKIVKDIKSIEKKNAGEITKERLEHILGEQFANSALKLYFSGSGITINGYISHPSSHRSRSSFSFIFLNKRPITEKGIVRSIYEGYSRYLPFGEKIDFVINIDIQPSLVDVNVHPRKEEVRFENPFRVYNAIEEAVKHTLEKELSYNSRNDTPMKDFSTMRESFNQKSQSKNTYSPPNIYPPRASNSVQDSLLFSKELLSSSPDVSESIPIPDISENNDIVKIFQIFNKYILIEFVDQRLWIVDQHAAAERINFEKLLKHENENLQNLLVPSELQFNKTELLFLEENISFFKSLGFVFKIQKDSILLETIPAEFVDTDFSKLFEQVFSLEDNIENLSKNLEKRKDDILATIACHGSVRAGQKLSYEEMLSLFKDLSKCNNPYSCPHGRPAIWKLNIEDIDHNFERTY